MRATLTTPAARPVSASVPNEVRMNPVRTALLTLLLLACGALGLATATAAEPSVGFNGWTNTPGVVEGVLSVRPINTTLPKPTYGYLEYLPKGYNASDTTTKWPVVFVLNGLGETGDGTDTVANGHQLTVKLTTNGPLFDVASQHWDFPSIVISPQSSGAWNQNNIKLMVDYVKANYRVDTTRIFMTGLGDGASGLFRFATAYPGVLAGAIPIEATYAPTTSAESDAIKHLPLWLVHAFSDAAVNRRTTVAWLNQATLADTGLASDVMAAYPGYGGTSNHYACDTDPATGLPLNPAGPVSTVANAVLTTGSATAALPAGNLIANAGSFYVALWTGSDAAPFTRVQYGADPTSYVVKNAGATGIGASKVFSGPSQTADAHITTPVGLVLSAYYQPATGTWAWPKTSGQTPPPAGTPDNRILTLYWQYDQTAAWSNTYLNGQVWDWLYSRAPLNGPVTPATVTLGGLSTVYTGAAQAPTVTTSPAGLAVTLTYNGVAAQPVNAGSYAVVATIANPAYSGSASGTLAIAPAPVAIGLSGLAATWDGGAKQATATTNPAGVPVNVAYSGGATPVEPGSYAVTATSATTNYTGAPATGTLVIAKANATVTLGQLAATADGNPKPVSAATVPVNLAVAVTYDGSPTVPSAPGTYALVATINDAHYQGGTTGTLTISAAPVSGLTLTEPGDHRVVQRAIGGFSGAVAFSGTITGEQPVRLDARVVRSDGRGDWVVDWTTIATAPAVGAWTGSLTVPQGGWYRVEVRSVEPGRGDPRQRGQLPPLGRRHQHPVHRPVEHGRLRRPELHRRRRPRRPAAQRRRLAAPRGPVDQRRQGLVRAGAGQRPGGGHGHPGRPGAGRDPRHDHERERPDRPVVPQRRQPQRRHHHLRQGAARRGRGRRRGVRVRLAGRRGSLRGHHLHRRLRRRLHPDAEQLPQRPGERGAGEVRALAARPPRRHPGGGRRLRRHPRSPPPAR